MARGDGIPWRPLMWRYGLPLLRAAARHLRLINVRSDAPIHVAPAATSDLSRTKFTPARESTAASRLSPHHLTLAAVFPGPELDFVHSGRRVTDAETRLILSTTFVARTCVGNRYLYLPIILFVIRVLLS